MSNKRKPSERAKRLQREGWTRQFLATDPRLTEAVELYRAIGYEIHLEPLARAGVIDSEDRTNCTVCFDGDEDRYKIIYTRPKKGGIESDDDMW